MYHRRGYGVGVEMEGLGSEVGLLGRYKYVPSGEGEWYLKSVQGKGGL